MVIAKKIRIGNLYRLNLGIGKLSDVNMHLILSRDDQPNTEVRKSKFWLIFSIMYRVPYTCPEDG